MTLTPLQQSIFDRFVVFLNSDKNIFILKGSAGTGKTTMIKNIVSYLDAHNLGNIVMAPTGRAAKVLRDKVGKGITIHKGIYNFDNLICKEIESEDISQKSFHYVFPVQKTLSVNSYPISVAVIDESSMISDIMVQGEFFTFGSGKLLSDLLEYSRNVGIRKLIFVGDNAQLPPVTDSKSNALDEDYFIANGFMVETAEMTEVIRQKEGSGILSIANDIRILLNTNKQLRNNFSIGVAGNDVLTLKSHEIIEKYLELYPIPEVGNGVIISYSNAQCYYYNNAIRNRLYGTDAEIQSGDVVLVNNNNYHTFGREIFNGDMAKVVSVGALETHKNIPVTRDKIKKHITLTFRNIGLLFPGDDEIIYCTIIESLLNSNESDISSDEQRALYIDFCIRHPNLKYGSDEFKLAIRNDKYFNALKVKYGYAITCHKAQGGEWETAFVDYFGQCGLSDSHLRWCYTATTRAKKTLYTINPPNITSFSKLKFSTITKVSAAPQEFYNPGIKIETPFDNAPIPIGVKIKLEAISNAIKESSFAIHNVTHCSYTEKIDFTYNEVGHIQIQAYYDKAGLVKRLKILNDGSLNDQLCAIINDAPLPDLKIIYEPSTQILAELYQKMVAACNELEIKITNVQEFIDRYYVLYCLKTDATFAYIQFYWGENKTLSTAMPKSELGDQDMKLKKLIESMQ